MTATAETYVLPGGETIDADQTQLVCDYEEYPTCLCAGDNASPFECCCFAAEGETACGDCNAVLVRIATNRGERVEVTRG